MLMLDITLWECQQLILMKMGSQLLHGMVQTVKKSQLLGFFRSVRDDGRSEGEAIMSETDKFNIKFYF
jgi:ABC-type uncharacterized transport system ATPase subunit